MCLGRGNTCRLEFESWEEVPWCVQSRPRFDSSAGGPPIAPDTLCVLEQEVLHCPFLPPLSACRHPRFKDNHFTLDFQEVENSVSDEPLSEARWSKIHRKSFTLLPFLHIFLMQGEKSSPVLFLSLSWAFYLCCDF